MQPRCTCAPAPSVKLSLAWECLYDGNRDGNQHTLQSSPSMPLENSHCFCGVNGPTNVIMVQDGSATISSQILIHCCAAESLRLEEASRIGVGIVQFERECFVVVVVDICF